MTAPLRIGVAGIGFGAGVHVPALLALPDVEVVALAGSTRERASTAASRLGVPVACAGLDELLDRELDAVTLALPPHLAAAAAEQALGRGLAVLCEKPLGDNATAAARLAALAAGRTTAMGFQFAELISFRALRAAIDAGRLGPVRQVAVSWLTQSFAHEQRRWSWKLDATRGGGVLNLLGAHVLFLAEWLLGPCRSVQASFAGTASAAIAPAGAQAAEDVVALVLTGQDGWVLSALIGNAAPGGHSHRWEVIGAKNRALLVNEQPDAMAGFRLLTGGDVIASEPDMSGDGRLLPFRALASRFVMGARYGRPASPDFAVGARVQRLIEAARQSAMNGRCVEVG
jgi:predicted dehydrogenase